MALIDRCGVIEDFRAAARQRLPHGLFEFIDRGAERELALVNNVEAFARLRLMTKFLVGLGERDASIELFRKRIAFPLAIAPTGAAGLCWFEGEVALAKAAATAGVPFTLTSTSLTPMAQIVKEAGGNLWFQLFPWKEEKDTFALIGKARDLGFDALVVTIDWGVGRTREYIDRTGFTDPISLKSAVRCRHGSTSTLACRRARTIRRRRRSAATRELSPALSVSLHHRCKPQTAKQRDAHLGRHWAHTGGVAAHPYRKRDPQF